MNIKRILASAIACIALVAMADGYTDGIEYYKAGQYANARTILERTLNAPSTDKAMAYYYLGQLDLIDGNTAAAKANFDRGIAANAECPYNYVGLGAIDLKNKQPKMAEEHFKEAQKMAKKNYEIIVDIARAYYNADPVAYAKEVEKYLAKAHKDSKNQEPSIYILEGDMLFDARDLGGAAGKYEQAITFDVNNPEGYVKYANAYIGVNPQFSLAKLEELLAKQPNSALAQRELAEKYYETSQWTKAAQQYGKYIQNPNHFPEDKARYSVLLYANSEYQNSLDVAKELLGTTMPNDFVMSRMLMLNLAQLGQYEAAADAAKKFFALTPKGKEKFNPIDYTTYASVLHNLGDDDAAIEQYQAAVNVDPTRADNWALLSKAYYDMKQFQPAAEAFEQYILNSEKANLTDHLNASARWLLAAANAEDDEVRAADADKGIAAIEQVISNAAVVEPDYVARKGALQLAKAKNTPDEDVFNTYSQVIEMLDAKPEYADPTNPANKLKLYTQAYLIIGNYYQLQGDTENQTAAYQKLDEYNSLLNNK